MSALQDSLSHFHFLQANDARRQYSELSVAHQSAQELVQKLQSKVDKIRRLTETCQQQEKIIEKMERIISNPKKNAKKGNWWLFKSTHYNNVMACNAFGSTGPVWHEQTVEQTFELFKTPWD